MHFESHPSTPDLSPTPSTDSFDGSLSRCSSPSLSCAGLPVPGEPRTPTPYLQHWKHFYRDDKMATIVVDNALFRVHRHFLTRESEDLYLMLDVDVQPKEAEGGNGDSPISLPGVSRQEFERLLDFLYEGMYPSASRSLHFWVDILSISTHFHMERIRQCAIDSINASKVSLDPVETIVLSVKYDVPEWLHAAYVNLCRRPSPLNVSEAKQLGWDTAIQIAQAREAVREKYVCHLGESAILQQATSVVDDIFFPPPPPDAPSFVDPFLSLGIFQCSEVIPESYKVLLEAGVSLTASVSCSGGKKKKGRK